MGYIRHHSIIVIGHEEAIAAAHGRAVELLAHLVSPVVSSQLNGTASFFVAPDGSKEGWAESEAGDQRRAVFVEHLVALRGTGMGVDFAEVVLGDDNGERSYVTTCSEDFDTEEE